MGTIADSEKMCCLILNRLLSRMEEIKIGDDTLYDSTTGAGLDELLSFCVLDETDKQKIREALADLLKSDASLIQKLGMQHYLEGRGLI